MKCVHQTLLTKEEGGNCMAACLASILELPLDAVPNAALLWRDGDFDGGWKLIEDWLDELGLRIDSFEVEPDGWIPAGYWIAVVPSDFLEGETHVVVFDGPRFFFDPRPDATRERDLAEVTAIDVLACKDPAKLALVLPTLQTAAIAA